MLDADRLRQIIADAPASLPGEHNRLNLAAALTVIDLLGLSMPSVEKALVSFRGLDHRLQLLGTKAGVRYINDSISTTPVSVSAALQTLDHENLVLLLGGLDRGLDWHRFARNLSSCTPFAIVSMPDNGPGILASLKAAGITPKGGMHPADGLEQALDIARNLVPDNGCILLSPGAPSFPHFHDFEDRGNQFKQLAGF